MNNSYTKQVELLLRILPIIAKEKSFALHGGTAINLFYFDFPRISVDIDLTYIPIETREKDLENIRNILLDLKNKIFKAIPNIKVYQNNSDVGEYKLICSNNNNVAVKIEVNTINRGALKEVEKLEIKESIQEQYNCFCIMNVVPKAQLWGGKILAALDRQHPRDLFDIMNFLKHNEIDRDIIDGFIFCLLSSKRPLDEILSPSLLEQEQVMESQFNGMTNIEFTYKMFESTRKELIEQIIKALTKEHKEFIVKFAEGEPNWSVWNYENYPGIVWKLQNIKKLILENKPKHEIQLNKLKQTLAFIKKKQPTDLLGIKFLE